MVSCEAVSGETVSGGSLSGESVSGESVSGETVLWKLWGRLNIEACFIPIIPLVLSSCPEVSGVSGSITQQDKLAVCKSRQHNKLSQVSLVRKNVQLFKN